LGVQVDSASIAKIFAIVALFIVGLSPNHSRTEMAFFMVIIDIRISDFSYSLQNHALSGPNGTICSGGKTRRVG
jgi:hypothetical protein